MHTHIAHTHTHKAHTLPLAGAVAGTHCEHTHTRTHTRKHATRIHRHTAQMSSYISKIVHCAIIPNPFVARKATQTQTQTQKKQKQTNKQTNKHPHTDTHTHTSAPTFTVFMHEMHTSTSKQDS